MLGAISTKTTTLSPKKSFCSSVRIIFVWYEDAYDPESRWFDFKGYEMRACFEAIGVDLL